MGEAAEHYKQIYRHDLEIEAEWLRYGARAKAHSVDLLTRELGRPLSSLCEFGCGTGAVLEKCIELRLANKWTAVDNSPEALQYVRDRLGCLVQTECSDIASLSCTTKVQVGVLSHVLEHLENPSRVLVAMHGRCDNLIAEVPLQNQPVPRLMDTVRWKLGGLRREDNKAGHIQFFSKTSFRKLLADSGWRVVDEHMYLPQQKDALLFSARRNQIPVWRALLPYYIYRLLGRAALALANVHYAVRAVPDRQRLNLV
jgi:SAM-dependent methyltransferase